jgi:hypothetical protein
MEGAFGYVHKPFGYVHKPFAVRALDSRVAKDIATPG